MYITIPAPWRTRTSTCSRHQISHRVSTLCTSSYRTSRGRESGCIKAVVEVGDINVVISSLVYVSVHAGWIELWGFVFTW